MSAQIDIFIRREGSLEPIHHMVHDGVTVEVLKIDLAGGAAEVIGIFLFEEDADEPLHDQHEIRHHGHGHAHKVLHHSRCRQVHVAVR